MGVSSAEQARAAYLVAHGLLPEDEDRCPRCGAEDAPGTPPGGSWWWPEAKGVRCRHCKALWERVE